MFFCKKSRHLVRGGSNLYAPLFRGAKGEGRKHSSATMHVVYVFYFLPPIRVSLVSILALSISGYLSLVSLNLSRVSLKISLSLSMSLSPSLCLHFSIFLCH